MRITAWLLVALSVALLGFGIVVTIVLGNEYGLGTGLLSVIVVAVGFAAIPAAIASSLFAKTRDL